MVMPARLLSTMSVSSTSVRRSSMFPLSIHFLPYKTELESDDTPRRRLRSLDPQTTYHIFSFLFECFSITMPVYDDEELLISRTTAKQRYPGLRFTIYVVVIQTHMSSISAFIFTTRSPRFSELLLFSTNLLRSSRCSPSQG